MNRVKLYAAACLVAGLALALLTPGIVSHAAPHLAPYLRHPLPFLAAAIPYVLCAALWLPWRPPAAAKIGLVLSILLLLAACVLYVPMLLHPGTGGGDMIGFAFLLISFVTTIALLGISVIAAIMARRQLSTRRH